MFVTSEILRENFAYGFPWITFALVHSGNTFTLNLIYYIGTYGLSYFTILLFLIPASIIQLYKKDSINFILKTYISKSLIVVLLSIILIFIRFENNINQEIDFSSDTFRFIANDRRVAKNTLENQSVYQDEVQKALSDMFPESKWAYEDVSNANERLAFTIHFNTDINILNKN